MKTLLLALALVPVTSGFSSHTVCHKPYASPLTPVMSARAAQIKCLATMIYGEARGESLKGQIAVAYSAVNRATKRTLCQVVLAPKQYSIFNNNPGLRAAALSFKINPSQKNKIDVASWKQAVDVAHLVVGKQVKDPTAGATHYVAYKSLKHIPVWTRKFKMMAEIENHTFFKDVSRGTKIHSG